MEQILTSEERLEGSFLQFMIKLTNAPNWIQTFAVMNMIVTILLLLGMLKGEVHYIQQIFSWLSQQQLRIIVVLILMVLVLSIAIHYRQQVVRIYPIFISAIILMGFLGNVVKVIFRPDFAREDSYKFPQLGLLPIEHVEHFFQHYRGRLIIGPSEDILVTMLGLSNQARLERWAIVIVENRDYRIDLSSEEAAILLTRPYIRVTSLGRDFLFIEAESDTSPIWLLRFESVIYIIPEEVLPESISE